MLIVKVYEIQLSHASLLVSDYSGTSWQAYQEVSGDLPFPGRMANFAAGVICLHMFSIVTLKIT